MSSSNIPEVLLFVNSCPCTLPLADISAVYDHGHALNRDLALPLSILGVVTSVLLPSALLLVLKGNKHQH